MSPKATSKDSEAEARAQNMLAAGPEFVPADQFYQAEVEIRHLRDMVQALRDTLEEARFETDEQVQHASSSANSEVSQLRNAVQAMRDEMENVRFERKKRFNRRLRTQMMR